MADIFGSIGNPLEKISGTTFYQGLGTGGLAKFFNNILRLLFLIGGLWAFLNFIFAGYGFLSSESDPKKIAAAWAKIWQSLVGLLIIVSSFVVAAIAGQLLFGSPGAILNPKIIGPGK